MGYCYGANGIVCDKCGTDAKSAGVRKRTCKYKVTPTNRDGSRGAPLAYCPAPALCKACYKAEGGINGVHPADRCGAAAAESQREYDDEARRYAAGDQRVVSAANASISRSHYPDDYPAPDGWVRCITNTDRVIHVPADEYGNLSGGWVDQYPGAVDPSTGEPVNTPEAHPAIVAPEDPDEWVPGQQALCHAGPRVDPVVAATGQQSLMFDV